MVDCPHCEGRGYKWLPTNKNLQRIQVRCFLCDRTGKVDWVTFIRCDKELFIIKGSIGEPVDI